MEASYYIIYQGDIESAFLERGLTNFMILNSRLVVLYTPEDFNTDILDGIYEIAWYSESLPMSSLIDLSSMSDLGFSARYVSGVDYIYNNSYNDVTGKDVLIAIIDSGVDYLHPDLINEDGSSKISRMGDQEGFINPPPEGYLFGSEFTREEINAAIARNDPSLTRDYVGTGTFAAGLTVGGGRINSNYKGIAKESELLVVKLKSYPGKYYVEKRNYMSADFLAAISYVIKMAIKEEKSLIINLTVAARSAYGFLTLINTFEELNYPGIFIVSGAGNERNSSIHHIGNLRNASDINDTVIEFGNGNNLDIYLEGVGIDRVNATIISPSGETSYTAFYAPDSYEYTGTFNLENTIYRIRYFYPWMFTGSELIEINLKNMKPGTWTLRVGADNYLNGEYHMYLPNKNLLDQNDRFIDSDSNSTITLYSTGYKIISVGTYDNRYDGVWVGSSEGPTKEEYINPNFLVPGVNVISTHGLSEYILGTGTGVSSCVFSGMLALIIDFIKIQSKMPKLLLVPEAITSYVKVGAIRKDLYEYPNFSYGYGVVDFKKTIQIISNNL